MSKHTYEAMSNKQIADLLRKLQKQNRAEAVRSGQLEDALIEILRLRNKRRGKRKCV